MRGDAGAAAAGGSGRGGERGREKERRRARQRRGEVEGEEEEEGRGGDEEKNREDKVELLSTARDVQVGTNEFDQGTLAFFFSYSVRETIA